ncbi:MAG: hypothetical protein ACPLY9_05010 [Nitrososphaerales archaeon]
MEEEFKESGLPIAGGILTIVAASLSLIVGVSVSYLWFNDSSPLVTWWIAIFGFSFGLISGVLVIKRRSLGLTLVGMAILLINGILPLLWSFIYTEGFLRDAWIRMFYNYGIPILVFSVLGIVFAVASRKRTI